MNQGFVHPRTLATLFSVEVAEFEGVNLEGSSVLRRSFLLLGNYTLDLDQVVFILVKVFCRVTDQSDFSYCSVLGLNPRFLIVLCKFFRSLDQR